MAEYRYVHLTGSVQRPRARSPEPTCTGRTHLTSSDIDADFYARKLIRNTAPSLSVYLDSTPSREKTPSVLGSGRYLGSSAMSPSSAYDDLHRASPPSSRVLDINERYSTPSHSTGLESTFRPYTTTRSVDIRTCPGRPKVFQPSHVVPFVTSCAKCFNNGKRKNTQVFCPHVMERCNTFGGAFEDKLFGQYRNVAMEKKF
ncbi:uncharacterized protein LOC114828221 [Galendromus occidentalis]|uniref:Uncharacterized protein LOC114828221 n=1 Tax=Galendromus occidentalis TaxID=34638 RepID=A0AAJ7WHG8_9ACAR|nr:uncharacterized protein LOC114828221 [Galendromus occidentalis]